MLCPVSKILAYSDVIDAGDVLVPVVETVVLMAAGMVIFTKRDLK